MSEDYADITNKQWDDIPEVQLLPSGSWRLRVRNASYQAAKNADQSPSVMIVYTPKEPMDDVDGEELAKLGSNYDVSANRIFTRFFVSDASDWDRVRKHVVKHGVEVKGSIGDTLKALSGHDVVAYVGRRTFTNNAGELQESNEAQNFASVE